MAMNAPSSLETRPTTRDNSSAKPDQSIWEDALLACSTIAKCQTGKQGRLAPLKQSGVINVIRAIALNRVIVKKQNSSGLITVKLEDSKPEPLTMTVRLGTAGIEALFWTKNLFCNFYGWASRQTTPKPDTLPLLTCNKAGRNQPRGRWKKVINVDSRHH